MNNFATDLVPGALYISMPMSVSEGAIRKEQRDCCAYDGKRLQRVLSVKPFPTGCSSILPEARDGQGARLFVLCI